MNKDPARLFYTQEEIDSFTSKERFLFAWSKFWYNFTEYFLTLKESDRRWMKMRRKKAIDLTKPKN